MPPAGGPKRKRSDRNAPSEDGPRASPHRPQELELAKQAQAQAQTPAQSPSQPPDDGLRLTRRQSRGGRSSNQQVQDVRPASPVADAHTAQSPTPATANNDTAMTNGQAAAGANSPLRSALAPVRMYINDYITDDVVSNWSDEGREMIKARLIDLVQEEPDVTLDVLVEEIVEAATSGRIDTHNAGLLMKECITSTSADLDPDTTNPIQDAILGVVPIVFAEENPSPHVTELAVFLSATEISAETLRTELDAKLLEQLGLIRNSFHRQVIRKQTNALYRQSNYNLLREESEGFSKLITELFTTSGDEPPHADVVNAAVEKVKAMIGAFDLDVGRSLDVVLDVFGSVLVKQYRFFVKFLRASPWWPRTEGSTESRGPSVTLGGLPTWALPGSDDWHLTYDHQSELARLTHERDTKFWQQASQEGLRAYFMLGKAQADSDTENRQEETIQHSGNREAAQLLGFKLRFYAPGADGDTADGTPRVLIYLAALLIKIGFISLHDLYPHLWRSDAEMDEFRALKEKEKKDKEKAARPGAGASNALAMAGALLDDAAPPAVPSRLRDQGTRASTPAKDTEPENAATKEAAIEKPDQKVLLLQSLLAIGALPEALFILGRFPWLMDLIAELPEYINRILHHSLSAVYGGLRPLQSRNSLHGQQPLYETEPAGQHKGHARLEQHLHSKTLRWPLLDRDDSEVDGVNYRFYWDEWNDNIPVCHSFDDVFILSKTLLPLVGAKIGQDASLVLKFARIGKASLHDDDSPANKDRWLDLIRRVLLPSLSLTKANPGVINEVYELISLYSTETRYRLYLDWLTGDPSKTDDMKSAASLAKAETLDVLKKISKTNVKPMARLLAKVAYANPHVVITTALRQIESYDSIADVFVEGSRYFTDLGYDVLSWALISGMGKNDRIGVQADGLFTERWLVAISHFAGKVYKRYNLMKPGPILQYVGKQLQKGFHKELIILEQLIVAMAGITPDTNYNDAQLLAMGGGPILQAQTILQLLDERHKSKQTAKRLMKALYECDLVSNLLLGMAQQRQVCIFQEGDAPLKAVGHSFDEITRILGQYIDLLRTNMSADEFQKMVPSTAAIMNEWDIPAELAFWIGRPMIQKQMNDFDRDNVPSLVAQDLHEDVDMKEEEASEEDGEAIENEDMPTSAATPTDNEITGNLDENIAETQEVDDQRWHPVLKGVMDDIKLQLPEEVQQLVGAGFYVTFWQLCLYDINVPGKSYEDEMSRNKKKIASIGADRSNVSSSGAKTRDNQIKAIRQLNEDILAENRQHLKAYGESRARLAREKDQWFAAKSRVSNELNVALMEYCFLPRILLSPVDAYFCFKFAKMLHSLATANFRTLGFYDKIFSIDRLTSIFFMCTSKEADNLGKFLCEVLKDLSRWQKNKTVYEKEAFGSKKHLPGFALKLENGKPQRLLDFDKFRDVLLKWQANLYAALTKCLGSPEYMHIRNAISVLRTVSPVFPAVDFHGRSLQKSVDKLRESDREDLKIASQALLGTLSRRQKEWISSEAFRKGPGALPDKSTSTPEPLKQEDKAKTEVADTRMRDAPAVKSEGKELEKTPSVHSREGGRSPARTSTPLPPRPIRDTSSLRPPRSDSRSHDLPRRVSPPPRFPSSSNLPSRPENDSRNGYRDTRPRVPPAEPPRPDSRSGYPLPRHTERGYEPPHDASHRYPRPSDRPSMLDRDERSARREHDSRVDPRAGHEERRYHDREARSDRESRTETPRHDREHTRPLDRDHPRPVDRPGRPERPDRDYGQSEYPDRRRDDTNQAGRREAPNSGKTVTPAAPSPAINPERAALIHANDERPSMSIRGQAQDRARSSRPSSPRRDDDRKHVARTEKDDRHDRGPDQSRSIQQPSMQAPPRGVPPSAPPSRDTRNYNRPQVDMAHGRLEQESSHRSSSRTERTDGEPPSGPRSRASNASLRNAEPAPPLRPVENRQPPSGPGGRQIRTNSYTEPTASPSTGDIGGVHPSRLNNLPANEPPRNQRPPPLQTAPPSGPRGPPTGPSSANVSSPSSRGPPSGPQADIPGGRGQRHPMAAVNSTLAQAANVPRGHPAGRGRGGMRQNSVSFNQGGMPPSPINGPPNQGFHGAAQDQMNNPNGMPVQPRGPPRQDGLRGEDDRRSTRSHQQDDRNHNQRDSRDGGYKQDDGSMRRDRGPPQLRAGEDAPPPRNGPRTYPRGPNPNGPGDDGAPPSRKHPRDDSNGTPYGSGGRGGRVASEAKRARRGGG